MRSGCKSEDLLPVGEVTPTIVRLFVQDNFPTKQDRLLSSSVRPAGA